MAVSHLPLHQENAKLEKVHMTIEVDKTVKPSCEIATTTKRIAYSIAYSVNLCLMQLKCSEVSFERETASVTCFTTHYRASAIWTSLVLNFRLLPFPKNKHRQKSQEA
eukprot:3778642-Amphidinium_carterae.1